MSSSKVYYEDITTSLVCVTPKVTVYEGSCFSYISQYPSGDIVLHNFANNYYQGGPCSQFTPDGRYIRSELWSNTQEDQIVRKYSDSLNLPRSFYPICSDDSQALIYSVLGSDQPDIITLPALNGGNYAKSANRQIMISRTKTMLYAARGKVLVTGLWGCGAFGGSPDDLLTFWQHALADCHLEKPREIVFAIILDGASRKWGSAESLTSKFRRLSPGTDKK